MFRLFPLSNRKLNENLRTNGASIAPISKIRMSVMYLKANVRNKDL